MLYFSEPDFYKIFWIKNLSDEDCIVTLAKNGSSASISLEYSVDDKSTWYALSTDGVSSVSFSIPANGNAYVKGENSSFSESTSNYYTFSFGKNCNIGGNIMSLANFMEDVNAYMFYRLFYQNHNIIDASELAMPANTSLYCFSGMFYGCTSLTAVPALPATTLAENCYVQMFICCTNLRYIKAMFLTTPSSKYTDWWVYGVSSTGKFVKNVYATWDVSGEDGIPSDWAVQTAAA